MDQANIVIDAEEELLIVQAFERFSTNAEMNFRDLQRLVAHSCLFDSKFTAQDLALTFEKAKHIASKDHMYIYDVIFEKRVRYSVFRGVVIPCLAERKGVSVGVVLRAISCDPSPAGVATLSSRAKDAENAFTRQISSLANPQEQIKSFLSK
jgi:hypothetical protein